MLSEIQCQKSLRFARLGVYLKGMVKKFCRPFIINYKHVTTSQINIKEVGLPIAIHLGTTVSINQKSLQKWIWNQWLSKSLNLNTDSHILILPAALRSFVRRGVRGTLKCRPQETEGGFLCWNDRVASLESCKRVELRPGNAVVDRVVIASDTLCGERTSFMFQLQAGGVADQICNLNKQG